MVSDHDGTEPSASSVACSNLQRLADYTQNQMYRDRANVTFNAFGMRLSSLPMLLPEMVCAYLYSGQQSYRVRVQPAFKSFTNYQILHSQHLHPTVSQPSSYDECTIISIIGMYSRSFRVDVLCCLK